LAEGPLRAWVLNGPNLNLLGTREPAVYGRQTLADLEAQIAEWAEELGLVVECYQANFEGELLERVHAAPGRADFLVVNPGALTHTSAALRDALAGVDVPALEVHLSNIHAREEWRRHSWISPVCRGVIGGLGPLGYRLALEAGARLFPRPRQSTPEVG
jgi:3-dehydroquinate dehydratase type II